MEELELGRDARLADTFDVGSCELMKGGTLGSIVSVGWDEGTIENPDELEWGESDPDRGSGVSDRP